MIYSSLDCDMWNNIKKVDFKNYDWIIPSGLFFLYI